MIIGYDFSTLSAENVVLVDSNKPFDSAYKINLTVESINTESSLSLSKSGVMVFQDPLPSLKESKDRIIPFEVNSTQFRFGIVTVDHTIDGFSQYVFISPSHRTMMLLRPNVLAKNTLQAHADFQYCAMYFILASYGINITANTQDGQIIESIRT